SCRRRLFWPATRNPAMTISRMRSPTIFAAAGPMPALYARSSARRRKLEGEADMNIQLSRREALIGSGALIVSFSLSASLSDAFAQGASKPLALTEVDSFLAIDKSGKVTVYSGKVDLGTGVSTALRQIVAEELDVPMTRIELIEGDTLLTPDQGTTWGSLTI